MMRLNVYEQLDTGADGMQQTHYAGLSTVAHKTARGQVAAAVLPVLGRNMIGLSLFFFSSRRRHTRCSRDWSSDVCSSDLIRNDIRYVVVDEYQDVNPLQERLVRGLVRFGANLCVVGDDDQTIYQWRGSQVANIVSFSQRYAGVQQVVLDDNFRSSKGVVELGRSIADRIPAAERLAKKMVAS